jgi:hypothetical protein
VERRGRATCGNALRAGRDDEAQPSRRVDGGRHGFELYLPKNGRPTRSCARKRAFRTRSSTILGLRTLGLDHYEGRRFPGWHHHNTVALCCYAFLVAERARGFPPSGPRARRTALNATSSTAAHGANHARSKTRRVAAALPDPSPLARPTATAPSLRSSLGERDGNDLTQ